MKGKDIVSKLNLTGVVVGVKIKGKIYDLMTDIKEKFDPQDVSPIYINSEEGMDIMRHSCAHTLAQAVKRLFPNTQISIGPTTDVGFFYDFKGKFTEEDLKKIEEEMRKIKDENLEIQREEIEKEKAIELFKKMGEELKVEILKDIDEKVVSIYRQGEFIDLCRGPHVPNTSLIGEFKLVNISESLFKGKENIKLTRIYGVAFPTKEELQKYFSFIEEMKRKDHRNIGRELEFFLQDENIGAGLHIWLPKGAEVRRKIENIIYDIHKKNGYNFVNTPHIAKSTLWEISGHTKLYKEFMFPEMKDEEDFETFILKPMNCPMHIEIFKSKTRSYRDLPLRIAEFGTVYRYERSGVLFGLMRARGFTQDDAHIFIKPEDLEEEILSVLEIIQKILEIFGFKEFSAFLSTRPEKRVGSEEEWDYAEEKLKIALEKSKINFSIAEGEGAFYGPKIDIKINTLWKSWQCSTIQLDFNLPKRFSAFYVDKDNSRKNPYIIHRAVLGSLERFFGILMEKDGGILPPWLSPHQCVIIDMGKTNTSKIIYSTLKKMGINVIIDEEKNLRLSKRIKIWEIEKIPFMIIIGEKEEKEGKFSIRMKGGENFELKIDDGIEFILEKCKKVSV